MATTNAKATPTTEVSDLAEKIREQLLSTVKHAQKLSIDAAQSWLKASSVISLPDVPAIPGVPALPGMEAVTTFTFDLAGDLLNAQRDYAMELAKVLAPAKSA
ncbi:MAG: hypothetical protein ABSH30_06975 [Acidimicrobiales bacterium]|jgi:hypothetical protein